uniref:Uncharacterized protein n=1 Tax=Amphimedon queenslandica TaxID=400682 RepID=A0A1X7U2F5_AMPQE
MTRAIQDQERVLSVLSPQRSSFSSNSLKDLFCLGKYDRNCFRSIIVKLRRSHDVTVIPSNKRQLEGFPNISICPDLSPSERNANAILVREHRSIISSGVDSASIKIRRNCIYLGPRLQGKVINASFVSESTTPPQTDNSDTLTQSVTPLTPPTQCTTALAPSCVSGVASAPPALSRPTATSALPPSFGSPSLHCYWYIPVGTPTLMSLRNAHSLAKKHSFS